MLKNDSKLIGIGHVASLQKNVASLVKFQFPFKSCQYNLYSILIVYLYKYHI